MCSHNAVDYMHGLDGHHATNYLGVLIGVAPALSADVAFRDLGLLLHDLGLEENKHKACSPSTSQTIFGVDIHCCADNIGHTFSFG